MAAVYLEGDGCCQLVMDIKTETENTETADTESEISEAENLEAEGLEVESLASRDARLDVAAAHRLAVRHGLNEGVWNHISYVCPDDSSRMLISPGHTHWSQVTASSLALMTEDGNMTSGERPPILAGWIIHRPVHAARADARCVIHVHAPYITAMSIRKDVLFETRSSQQSAGFHNDVVYYDVYDGLLDSEDEGARMAEMLGDKRVLMLRNHGALVVAPTVARAYLDVYQLERACMYQLLASAGGGEMQLIPEDIATAMGDSARESRHRGHWDGMKRWMDAAEPDYRD
jgi:ribulose-5-phosphate 4-epimerase/fuculose-1-phosphate aldolase